MEHRLAQGSLDQDSLAQDVVELVVPKVLPLAEAERAAGHREPVDSIAALASCLDQAAGHTHWVPIAVEADPNLEVEGPCSVASDTQHTDSAEGIHTGSAEDNHTEVRR